MSRPVTVSLYALTAFLLVLALLGTQLSARRSAPVRSAVVLRKIYRTTVIERVIGARPPSTSSSTSQSSAGGYAPLPVATKVS